MRYTYQFGPFHFQPDTGYLLSNDEPYHLREKTAKLLILFLESGGECLLRDHLIEAVWEGEAVTDHVLTQSVSEIRKALGDRDSHCQYVRTLPKRGYQWVGGETQRVLDTASDHLDQAVASTQPHVSTPTRNPLPKTMFWLPILLCLPIVMLTSLHQPVAADQAGQQNRPRLTVLPFLNETQDPRQDWVQLGLLEMVDSHLRADRQVHVTPLPEVLNFWSHQPRPQDRQSRLAWYAHTRDFFQADHVLEVRLMKNDDDELPLRLVCLLIGDRREPIIRQWAITSPFDATRLVTAFLNQGLALENPIPETDLPLVDKPFAQEAYAMGLQASSQGDLDRARHYFQVCVFEAPHFLLGHARLAMTVLRMGDREAATDMLQRLQANPRLEEQVLAKNITLKYAAILAKSSGDFETAECLLMDALATPQNQADTFDRANLANELALLYEKWGRFSAADQWFGEAVRVAMVDGAPCLRANASMNLANLEIARGKVDLAETLYLQSLTIYAEMSHEAPLVTALSNMAQIYAIRENYPLATMLCQQVLAMATHHEDYGLQTSSLHNLGALASMQEQWTDATKYFQKALALSEREQNPYGQARSQLELARVARNMGQLQLAENHYRETMVIAETMQHLQLMETVRQERAQTLAGSP